ncbi:MAG: SDR family oxidoreductase [Candidatus Aminicenantes bacterium]|nr:SDR family oxidoreductase [Candidatus Aminicenantes bacterium]MBL7082300.1 SDR family oxidoreductase [Candidatus Aminicenantes bacterium]
MSEIRDLRVLITGASSGIGKALAFEFANKGAKLAITSRSFGSLRKVADELEDTFPGIQAPLAVACDVANREKVNQLIKRCEDQLGGIDILINNAGTGVYGYSEMTALEDFRSVMEVNFFGAVHCILRVLPLLKKNGSGLIVNISSVAAMYGVPYLGAYSASKAALVALGQSLRAELAGSGVSIMNVYPGYTQTGFFEKEKNVGGAHRPPGPYVSPQRVAKTIVRAIKKEKQELILSLGGKMLALSRSFLPWLVIRVMKRIANKLRNKKEEFNE